MEKQTPHKETIKNAILVIGGAGYIGSHTCKLLKLLGYTPITYDNLCRGHESSVKWGPFVQGDLFDYEKLTETLKIYKIEAVIHFAAYAYVGESVHSPNMYFKNNLYGSSILFEAMRSAGVKNIVFSSTCAVYGAPQKFPITEEQETNPINPYGLSKLMTEKVLLKYKTQFGFNPCILRYFNAGGADSELETGELHDPEPHFLPNILKKASNDQSVEIFGKNFPTHDGTCVRDFIHVSDLAKAHILALNWLQSNSNKQHPIFNLGTGTGMSLLEIVSTAELLLNKKINIEFLPPRYGDPAKLVASSKKAEKELGWSPQYSDIKTILKSAQQWMEKSKHPS